MSEADFPYTNIFVQYCPVLHSTVQYCTVLYSTVQYCTVLYSIVQYFLLVMIKKIKNALRPARTDRLEPDQTGPTGSGPDSTVQYCTVLYSTVQYRIFYSL